jgi:hypothetical protein
MVGNFFLIILPDMIYLFDYLCLKHFLGNKPNYNHANTHKRSLQTSDITKHRKYAIHLPVIAIVLLVKSNVDSYQGAICICVVVIIHSDILDLRERDLLTTSYLENAIFELRLGLLNKEISFL